MNKLKDLYTKQEAIKKLRSELREAEEEFKELCKKYKESNYTQDGNYQLVVQCRKVRRITDPKTFINQVGELGWVCLSVSMQKCDVLKINVPQQLVEVQNQEIYKVVKK